MGEIRFGTSFRNKHTMALLCYRSMVETKFHVRIVVDIGEYGSGSVDVYGRDEDRVVKALIDIINAFPNVFTGSNMGEFSTEISSFDQFLKHPRSYGMNFSWNQ